MTCDDLTGVYELYALGILDGAEREALEEHLNRSCVTCMNELNRAVETNSIVFCAVPGLQPPERLRTRVLAGFGLETRPFWLRALPWSVAFVSALLLLTIAFPGSSRRVSLAGDRQNGLLLVVAHLPPPGEGQMYETWIVPRTGAPRPVGQLTATDKGDAVGRIPGPLDAATIQAVAVSIEPAGSHPVTPTKVLFATPLNGS